MAVRDLWHYTNAEKAKADGVKACKCSRGSAPWYPTLDHMEGMRWRVEVYIKSKLAFPTESFADNDKAAADARFDELKAKLNRTRRPVDKKREKQTLLSLLDEYINDRVSEDGKVTVSRSRRTQRSWVKNHIAPYFGEHTAIGDIDEYVLRKFKDHMATKTKPNGALYSRDVFVNVYGLVASVLKYAVARQKLTENPSSRVKYPQPDKVDNFVLWEDDVVGRILGAMSEFDRTIARLAATCGHRQGEAFGVLVSDIHKDTIDITHQIQRGEDGVVRLEPCKHGSLRRGVPLPAVTAEALAAHMRDHEPLPMTCTCHPGRTWQLVFSRRGRPILTNTWNNGVWKKALLTVLSGYLAAGQNPPVNLIPTGTNETGMHQLRHHAISLWGHGGVSPTAAMKWAGHKDLRMIEKIYGHVFKAEAERGRAIMDKTHGATGGPPTLRVVG